MDLNRTDGRSISLRIHHNCGLHSLKCVFRAFCLTP